MNELKGYTDEVYKDSSILEKDITGSSILVAVVLSHELDYSCC